MTTGNLFLRQLMYTKEKQSTFVLCTVVEGKLVLEEGRYFGDIYGEHPIIRANATEMKEDEEAEW